MSLSKDHNILLVTCRTCGQPMVRIREVAHIARRNGDVNTVHVLYKCGPCKDSIILEEHIRHGIHP